MDMGKPLSWRVVLLLAGLAAPLPARALDGVWYSTKVHPSQLAGFSPTTVAPDGTPYVLYGLSGGGGFLARWGGSGWVSEPVSANYSAGTTGAIKADSQGAVHMTFGNLSALRYARRDGFGISLETVPGVTFAGDVRLLTDAADRPHILYRAGSSGTVYRVRASSGVWSSITVTTSSLHSCDMAMAPNQDVFIGCTPTSSNPPPVSIYRVTGSSVTLAGTMPAARFFRPGLVVDGAGTLYQAMVHDPGLNDVLALASFSPPSTHLGQIFVNAMNMDALAIAPGHILAVAKSNSVLGGQLLEKNGAVLSTETLTFSYTGTDVFSPALSPAGRLYISAGTGFHAKLSTTSLLSVATRTASGVEWSLSHPSGSDATGFRLRRVADGADLSGLLPPGTAGFSQTGLTPNSPVEVSLENIFPGFAVQSSTRSFHTLAAAPRALTLTRTAGGGLSALWSANGNPAGTEYRLRFQAVGGFALDQSLTNTSLFLPAVLPIPTAMTLQAVSNDDLASPYATLLSFTRSGQTWRAAFDLENGSQADVEIIGPAEGQSIVLAAGAVETFPAASISVADLTATGLGLQVETGQALPAGLASRVTLRYSSGALAGFSGTLVLARFDQAHGAWVPLPTVHDALARTFSSPLDAFGVLQVMARAGSVRNLGNAAVYPNPYRPASGVLTLREIPAGARIKIMTAAGRVVREFSGTDQPAIQWDGVDARGERVKSGVYTVRIENNGEDRRFRILVEN